MKKSKHIRRVVSVGPLDRKIVKSSNESKLSHINFKNSEARNTHVASISHQDQIKRPRTTTAVVRVSRSQVSSFTICKFHDQQQSPNNVEQPFNDQLIHDDIYATISSDVQIDLDHNIQTPLSTKTSADQVSKHSARSSSRIHPEKINVSQIDCNSINDRILAQQLHLRAAQQLRLQPAQQLRLQPAQQLRLQLVQQLRLQPAQQLRLLAAQQQQRQQQQRLRQQQVNLNS
ncbi:unnamed protein product [Rotaria sordida]|uniref:Uncharacterized protein n=1 Tax=Rotaria sordida TaxID=392033 RepID=A0A819FWY3_9BILA|nr:unnamed protein product [Rotaria sordida]